MSGTNFLERLLDGAAVEWKPLGDALVRTKGTKITASQMKTIHKEDASLKIFAGGKTVAFIDFEDIPAKAQVLPFPPLDEQVRIASLLDKFDTLTHSIREGLPREIELRQKQYEYYRDLLLTFPKAEA
jgi:hypothetical protein